MQFLGCLFFFIFGIFFVVYAFGRQITEWLIRRMMRRAFGNDPQRRSSSSSRQSAGADYDSSARHAGNAHHEGHGRGNSRQRRSGKIFSQDEGTYVDFEEVDGDR